MKKFIVIYHAPVDAVAQTANATPEEQAKGMEGWMKWAEKTGKKLLDLGAPLFNGKLLHPDGSSTESSNNVVGYSIVEADNMDEAIALFKGHPHLGWNADCDIEVHETMDLPGM